MICIIVIIIIIIIIVDTNSIGFVYKGYYFRYINLKGKIDFFFLI